MSSQNISNHKHYKLEKLNRGKRFKADYKCLIEIGIFLCIL